MDTLYSFRRCPYAIRARLALLVAGARFEIREVALRDKPGAMIDLSPKATVPVLALSDGRVIDQSIDIMRWALAKNDSEDWLRGDDAALIDTFDTRFKQHLDRYKYPGRHGTDPVRHRDGAMTMLIELECRLSTTANLCRTDRSITDMAILPFVRQFAGVDRPWFDARPLPRLRRWLDGHVASPLFGRCMTRLTTWTPGAARVIW